MGIQVTINLNKLPQIAARLPQAAADGVRELAETGLAYAEGIAPVESGEFRDSIQIEGEGSAALELTAGKGIDDERARYLEEGTSKMVAQPTMTPTGEMLRERLDDTGANIVRKAIE